jgi:glycosyltransferase involved in cell wall biosynthesis
VDSKADASMRAWKIRSVDRPQVTVAVPSLNQGRFLEACLTSIFSQQVPVEVFVADAGSSDGSLDVLTRWQTCLAGWRSHPDQGTACAINECIALGSAPYVAWLNSDDLYLPGGLTALLEALKANPDAPAAYGSAWNVDRHGSPTRRVWTERFDEARLAVRCIVSQPASLIRRNVWESLGGLNGDLGLAFDYDLWWRILRAHGSMYFVEHDVACNRQHPMTKTANNRGGHYKEAISVVKRHYGRVPLKWRLAWPYAVWWRQARARLVNRSVR